MAQICDDLLAGSSAPSSSKSGNIGRARDVEWDARARNRDGAQTMAADSGRLELAGPVHFEWVQNKSSVYWTAEEVDTRLNTHMVQAARRAKAARKKYDMDMRTASYCAALEQIGDVYNLRGVFP